MTRRDLCDLVSHATQVPIPVSYPGFGSDAFRTGAGEHAAAVIRVRRGSERPMQPETQLALDCAQSGRPAALEPGRAVVELHAPR